MKELSIIIATYNAETTLQKCLDSIISQKSEDIELIIIDGGSHDETTDIVNHNSDFIDKYVSEPDNGIYDAWNKGIKLSTGRWIMFVGADDRILPNTLGDYVDFASNADDANDIITAKSNFIDLKGHTIKIVGEPYHWDKYKRNMNISHGSTLHNRRLFSEVGLYNIDYKICADYEFFMRKGALLKGLFYDHVILEFKIGGASFSFRCQKDTFEIRKKYKTVPIIINFFLSTKRVLGIVFKRIYYSTNEYK